LPELVKPAVVKVFEKHKVLSHRELHARYEVYLEAYNKTINVEGQLMVLMANRHILPAALEYQKDIGQSVVAARAAGRISVQGKKLLGQYSRLIDRFKTQADGLNALLEHLPSAAPRQAKYQRDKVVPAMAKLRETGDQIEVLTPDSLWPLPTYREMLFVK
jgi:glutamine synthetase